MCAEAGSLSIALNAQKGEGSQKVLFPLTHGLTAKTVTTEKGYNGDVFYTLNVKKAWRSLEIDDAVNRVKAKHLSD